MSFLTLLYFIEDLSLNLELPDLDSIASQCAVGILSLSPEHSHSGILPYHFSFYLDAEDSNSGSYDCTVSALSMESSFKP